MTAASFKVLAALALAAAPAQAHIALWHPSMYGWPNKEAGNPMWDRSINGPNDGFINTPAQGWFFHGLKSSPPADGVFMELPSGGAFKAEISCDPNFTSFGTLPDHAVERACPNPQDNKSGPLHSADPWDTPVDQVKDVKGSGIAIVYESDVNKIKPEDMVMISVNHRSPWNTHADFQIPAGLPPCPPGGCHCLWGWIHGTMGGKSDEMYVTGYRCNVTNADPNGKALPKPQVARFCPEDKSNCTVGAKQPHYWQQAEGNNNFREDRPPYYNDEYGFKDGAQTDIWDAANVEPTGDSNSLVASTPSGSSSTSASSSATVTPSASVTESPIPSSSANATDVTIIPAPSGTDVPPVANATTSVEPPAGNATTSVEPPAGNATTTVEPPVGNATTTVVPPGGNATTTVVPPGGNATTSVEPPVSSTTAPVEPPVTSSTVPVEPTTSTKQCKRRRR